MSPPNAAKELQNVSLVGQNKTAVVVGGTMGMGAAIARHLAKLGCSRVIILGRNETRAQGVLVEMKKLAPKEGKVEVAYVKGDLSDTAGMRAAAAGLQTAAGDHGIDYLVLTQNGVPKGTIDPNADGYDTAMAIQCVSRFALTYLLTTRGALAPNAIVLAIAGVGQSLDDLRVDDLDLRGKLAAGASKLTMFIDQAKRNSSMLDACNEEFNTRYPQYRYLHLWPGLVSSEEFSVSKFPAPLNIAMWIGIKTIGTTPEKFANNPVYLLASPDAQKTLGADKYFDYKLNPMQPGKWAKDAKNRAELWDKLIEMVGEK
ncbi:hypothetical protein C8R44DRAFT_862252 [Mycena epipterygia]|nr:hypothetical protein C8R44DRAFT_862252 [Mycena epipterygia]